MLPHAGLKPVVPVEDDTSCWSKQAQRDQTHFTCPSISARMRKRRTFADKELENVMLKHELRQRELQSDLTLSSTGLVPVLHPPPMSISPSLHCCPLSKDPNTAGTSSYVPLYECDFHFYQFFHLKSRSHTEGDYNDVLLFQSSQQTREDEEVPNGWKRCENKGRTPSQHRLKHHSSILLSLDPVKSPSKPTEIMNSSGSSTVTHSIFEPDQRILGGPDIGVPSKTFDPKPVTAKGWSADTPAAPAGAHADTVKSPHGSSVRTPAVRPLPFSVEALLRA